MDSERKRRPAEEGPPLEGGGVVRLAPASSPRPRGPAPRRVRRYEELEGGTGRGVFFRPHRHSASDLAPLRCVVLVGADGEERECALRDVSQNGVAFAWPTDRAVAIDDVLTVAVRFDTHVAFRGEARVGSVRQQDGTTVVGVSLQEFLLDVDEILQLRDVELWRSRPEGRIADRPWKIPGCGAYKSLLSEMRLLFEDARQELGALEAGLPWHVLHGEANPARDAIVAQLRTELVPEVVALSERIDEAVRELPGGHRDPVAREWSRRTIEEYLLQAPGAHRARHKPFGYPGDYEVMNFIYERPFEGASLFARAVELSFWHARCSVAVRARKDLVKRELAALLARRAGSTRPVRVLSVAAGPATELAELFDEIDDLRAPMEVVLFEQDKGALAHAWRRLEPTVSARFRGRVRFTFLHDSIKRLLRDPHLFEPFGEFDLIYSVGLLDYLQQLTAVSFLRNLAAAIAPGGRMLVANMVDHPARWYLEVPLDWQLVYRTRDELLEIGSRAMPSARLRILEEESAANPFIELLRP